MNVRLAFFEQNIGKSMTMGPSPVSHWLGGTLRAVTEGSITVEFTIKPEHTNPMGNLHGGVAATMMDDVIGAMTFAMNREYAFVSLNLNCDFLSAARAGDVIMAHAEVIRAGRNVIHCECKLTKADGKIVAKSASNMIQTTVKL